MNGANEWHANEWGQTRLSDVISGWRLAANALSRVFP